MPGGPVAKNMGMRSLHFGLLWRVVACYLALFRFLCTYNWAHKPTSSGVNPYVAGVTKIGAAVI